MYYFNKINEGFDVAGTKLILNPRHNIILNTSLSGEPVKFTLHSNALGIDIDVYSIFKRMQLTDEQRELVGLRPHQSGDANPVIYALKKEKGWGFKTASDEKQFYRIFEHILRRWLREHKNNYNTALLVPSSRRLNQTMMDMIKKISDEVGIQSFINKGLIKMTTTEVADMVLNEESYFYKYWNKEDAFDIAYEKLARALNEMDLHNNGIFTYHLIEEDYIRKTVIHTIKWADGYSDRYLSELNDKDLLIIDDTITHGQTIESTINAVSCCYAPKSVSVLTMFSKLYDSDGNEIEDVSTLPDFLKKYYK